jgi:phosphopantothenoylcysteine decarboxylase / phosphopantothenate---cysteine ligase
MQLQGKKIILGITGSIAAYKAGYLLRGLVKQGAEVQVVMTPSAKEFITPLTLSALSGRPVLCDFFDHDSGSWNSHVDLGLWADLLIVAPATASTISKMANGLADTLLVTSYLSAKCPVMIAPAMDLDMLQHRSTLKNLNLLRSFGNIIIEPAEGELASGLIGRGRMEEPEAIVNRIIDYFDEKKKLLNKVYLVTAGPTHEKIDPVRYIGNYSSGKMGFAIAERLAALGAKVFLVTGPVNLKCKHPNIERINVTSAIEMFETSLNLFHSSNGAIMVAAVADYAPVKVEEKKLKRSGENLIIELRPNPDIAARLGEIKRADQILAGFALETNEERTNALSKLKKKNLDFIVLNSLRDSGSGFQHDTNKISILDNKGYILEFELKPKIEVAVDIVNKLIEMQDSLPDLI